jgi:hypothetical protein
MKTVKLPLLAALLVGCTGTVEVPAASSEGASSSSTSSTGAGGGAGGAGGAGGEGGFIMSSSSAGGGPPAFLCPPGSVIHYEGDGAPGDLTGVCSTGWGGFDMPTVAHGRVVYTSESGNKKLYVEGCGELPGEALPRVSLLGKLLAEGSVNTGLANYQASDATAYATDTALELTVTKFGAVGEMIDGSFTAVVTREGGVEKRTLTGTFSVCRAPDGPPLP